MAIERETLEQAAARAGLTVAEYVAEVLGVDAGVDIPPEFHPALIRLHDYEQANRAVAIGALVANITSRVARANRQIAGYVDQTSGAMAILAPCGHRQPTNGAQLGSYVACVQCQRDAKKQSK